MRFRWFAACFFALTFAAWLARAEMHTDDTGILVGLIGVGGFLASLVEPRRPWMWGVIVPSGIILGNAWRHSQAVGGLLAIAGLTIGIGCAGAYLGAFIRRAGASTKL